MTDAYLSRVPGKSERVSKRTKMSDHEIVRAGRGEPGLLLHRVAELVVAKIRLAEIAAEIQDDRREEQREEAAKGARSAAGYHCDCAPSIKLLTI